MRAELQHFSGGVLSTQQLCSLCVTPLSMYGAPSLQRGQGLASCSGGTIADINQHLKDYVILFLLSSRSEKVKQ